MPRMVFEDTDDLKIYFNVILIQFGLIGLGSNIMGSADNSSWAALRLVQLESIHPVTVLIKVNKTLLECIYVQIQR